MGVKGKIKITTKRKNIRVPLPDDLAVVLKDLFYQHGAIEALADATGIHRHTISDTKVDFLATKEVAAALRKGIAKLEKQAA